MELFGEYDCVVLGEHPAGLWAALHLADLDQRVLVLPLDPESGPNALPRQVALDFGWTPDDWDRGPDLLQILTPERRFRIGPTMDAFLEEYEFQFGGSPDHSSNVSNELVRGLAFYARGSETGPVIGSEWKAWAGACLDTVYFEKDPGYVVHKMLRQLSARGVHIAKPGALRQIFVDRGNLVGVQLAGSSRMIAARFGFLCTQIERLRSLMTEPQPWFSDPQGWKFSMKLSCNPSALPVGLGSRMLYVQGGAPILEIHQTQRGEFRLTTQLPLVDESFDRGYQRRLCERMIRVCQEVIPDLEYNLQMLSPELRDPERAEKHDLPRMHPFQAAHEVPWGHLVFGASRGLGHTTPVGNLFLLGDEAHPRQGLWGAFQAAVASLDALAKKDPRQVGRATPSLNFRV